MWCFIIVAMGLAHAPLPPNDLFALDDVRAIVALENGPIALRVRISYQGQEKALIHDLTGIGSPFELEVPSAWKPLHIRQFGGESGARGFKKGECYEVMHYLHHDYGPIGAGKHEISLVWRNKVTIGNGESFVPNIRKTVMIEVEPSGKDQVQSACRLIEELACKPKLSYSDQNAVVSLIEHTDLDELAVTALHVLPRLDSQKITWGSELKELIYRRSRQSNDVWGALIAYLSKSGNREDKVFFEWWHRDKVEVGRSAVRELMRSPDIWVRSYTAKHFANLCNKDSLDQLRLDIEELNKSIGNPNEP